jgi:predicted DNA-binding protein
MAKRITYDVPIGMSAQLRESVTAWARHFNQPRSEYCREIIERHQKRVGLFPPAQSENAEINSPGNPLEFNPSN